MIFSDFLKALGQVTDPRFRRVLWLGLALTLALLIVLYAVMMVSITAFVPDSVTLPLIGVVGGVDTLVSLASIGVLLLLSMVLMIPVASAFSGLFLDDIARAVEARHYPNLPPATAATLGQALIDTINFFGLMVAVNLVGLIFYIMAGPFMPLIFIALNGLLLGREYFQIAALRRMSGKDARALRRRHFFQIWLAGMLMAAPLTVPLVNLIVPILGAATFTHLFHRVRNADRGQSNQNHPPSPNLM